MEREAAKFQFQSGAIKRQVSIVELKPEHIGFNSSLVRLKGAPEGVGGMQALRVFQFQSGAIKRQVAGLLIIRCAPFQFQSGAIKRQAGPAQSRP